MPTSATRRPLAAILAGVLVLVGSAAASAAPSSVHGVDSIRGSALSREAAPSTAISLNVKGCKGCRLQPVQTSRGEVGYQGATTKVRDGAVSFAVPTERTEKMSFLLYAPFDKTGLPAVVITRFRGKAVGSRISDRDTNAHRTVSGCWAGTGSSTFRATVVVKKREIPDPFGVPGTTSAAAAFLRTTVASKPFYQRLPKSSYHSADPSICR